MNWKKSNIAGIAAAVVIAIVIIFVSVQFNNSRSRVDSEAEVYVSKAVMPVVTAETETETVTQEVEPVITEADEAEFAQPTIEFVEMDLDYYRGILLPVQYPDCLKDSDFVLALDYMADNGFDGCSFINVFPESYEDFRATELVVNYAGSNEYYYSFADDEHEYEVIVENGEILIEELEY